MCVFNSKYQINRIDAWLCMEVWCMAASCAWAKRGNWQKNACTGMSEFIPLVHCSLIHGCRRCLCKKTVERKMQQRAKNPTSKINWLVRADVGAWLGIDLKWNVRKFDVWLQVVLVQKDKRQRKYATANKQSLKKSCTSKVNGMDGSDVDVYWESIHCTGSSKNPGRSLTKIQNKQKIDKKL